MHMPSMLHAAATVQLYSMLKRSGVGAALDWIELPNCKETK